MQAFERLEAELAEWAGYSPEQMVVCSTGSAALHLAFEAMRLPQGSEVLVPDFTFIACPRAATLAGLCPVFVDCDERLLMDWSLLKGQEFKGRVAVMCVHVHGRRMDMERVHSHKESIVYHHPMFYKGVSKAMCPVIEDLSQAHGVRPHPSTDAACWSFNRTKVIAGEEGGAVAFRDPEHAKLARCLRSQGNLGDWTHRPRGMNYRMQNCSAELIFGDDWDVTNKNTLLNFNRNIANRRETESWYDEYCPAELRMPPRDVPWIYDVMLPPMGSLTGQLFSDAVAGELRKAGIEARSGFKPMHGQEEYKGHRFVGHASQFGVVPYPRSWQMAARIVALPIQPGITTRESCREAFRILKNLVG